MVWMDQGGGVISVPQGQDRVSEKAECSPDSLEVPVVSQPARYEAEYRRMEWVAFPEPFFRQDVVRATVPGCDGRICGGGLLTGFLVDAEEEPGPKDGG